MLYSSIPDEYADLGLKPDLWKNATEELAFHRPPHTSSIVSKPGTSAIRGGKKDMYYDEAAHIPKFLQLWQAGLPAISRDKGRVTVISTPLGQSGLYYDLWRDDKFSHHLIPWWESRFFVKDALDHPDPYGSGPVAEAIANCPNLDTDSRVKKYGNDKINDILYSGLMGDISVFRTEYECEFVDERDAYFPYDLIMNGGVDQTLSILKYYPTGYEPVGDISIGVDLAKERDQSVFTVVEHIGEEKFVRFIHATQDDYTDQWEYLSKLIAITGARRITIDQGGPGNDFIERARRGEVPSGVNVEGVVFNQRIKEQWATQFKGALQLGTVKFPPIKPLIDQIHGIKRTRTENNFFKFAGKADDYFWSLMLALYGEGHRPVTFSILGKKR